MKENTTQKPEFQWETPVIYQEEWLQTLTGIITGNPVEDVTYIIS